MQLEKAVSLGYVKSFSQCRKGGKFMKHKPEFIFKKVSAVFLSTLVFLSVIVLPSCNSNEPENVTEPETTTATTVSEDVVSAAKAAYCEEISMLCNLNSLNIDDFGGVFLFENTADGVPILAVSTVYDLHPSPDFVYKYVDGKVISIYPESAGTGSTVKDEFWFVDGTDIMVYRYFGNSGGTFGSGEQIIYSDFKNGGCSQVSQTFSVDWVYSCDDDLLRAQEEMRQEMDAELLKITGAEFKLISFKYSYITESIYKYLHDNIGLTLPSDLNSEESETENAPKTKEYYFDLYESDLITDSRFSTIEEMADYYTVQWTRNRDNRTPEQIIEDVDVYNEYPKLIISAAVSYLYDKGYTLYDFEDEFFYLQVSQLQPGSEEIDETTLLWLEDLLNLFPEDFNKFSIIKAYQLVSKEVIIINSLAYGEKIVDFDGYSCVVTKRIAEQSYESLGYYYYIHEYFGIKEKAE